MYSYGKAMQGGSKSKDGKLTDELASDKKKMGYFYNYQAVGIHLQGLGKETKEIDPSDHTSINNLCEDIKESEKNFIDIAKMELEKAGEKFDFKTETEKTQYKVFSEYFTFKALDKMHLQMDDINRKMRYMNRGSSKSKNEKKAQEKMIKEKEKALEREVFYNTTIKLAECLKVNLQTLEKNETSR